MRAYRAALDLYTGELLPEDRYQDWAARPREKLREIHLQLLLDVARLHQERGEYADAIGALRGVPRRMNDSRAVWNGRTRNSYIRGCSADCWRLSGGKPDDVRAGWFRGRGPDDLRARTRRRFTGAGRQSISIFLYFHELRNGSSFALP